MWNAPSDRDYYDQFEINEPEPDDICEACGANFDKGQVCEEECKAMRNETILDWQASLAEAMCDLREASRDPQQAMFDTTRVQCLDAALAAIAEVRSHFAPGARG